MCFLIFACVASTLVWDVNGFGYGGYVGATGGGVAGSGPGYYGGSYGYGGSYMTPQSAKAAMISMAAVNFLVSLGFLVGSFSRSRAMRGCRFYLTVFICDIILAVLQGIIDIIFVIGVNPMSQSSQSMLYNPMLMMCQNIPGSPSLSAAAGGSFPGGYPMYSQYLHHYCYMDPEESVALVLGLMVVLALSFAAYYAYKTRSKIWRHGKSNIYWDEPPRGHAESPDLRDWVDQTRDSRSTQQAPTLVISETAAPDLRLENSPGSCGIRTIYQGNQSISHGNRTASIQSGGNHKCNSMSVDSSAPRSTKPPSQRCAPLCSSASDLTQSTKKLSENRVRSPRPEEPPQTPGASTGHSDPLESQCEAGYTTGGDTANELDQDQDHSQQLFRLYPAILTDDQRREYKREFDSDLALYKTLCMDMDDISDQMHKLSRELDTLDHTSVKYQGVADEYNRLKDLKRTPEYQAKKKESKELRRKLFHIKQLVKIYDQGMC